MSVCGQGPVELYLEEYRDKFAASLSDFIAEAVRRAGIDEAANAVLAKEIYSLQCRYQRLDNRLACWIMLLLALIITGIIWGFIAWSKSNAGAEVTTLHGVLFWTYIAGALLFICLKCIPAVCSINTAMNELKSLLDKKKSQALAQLRPLYSMFDWNTGTKLIEKLMPQLKFDDYMPEERLADFRNNFDFDTNIGQDRSVLFSHSGTFHGYPFYFLHNRVLSWGTKTYCGTKTIYWTERVRDSDGKWRTVHRSEVLTASVTKPYPEFLEEKSFVFGHDAAPKLHFSRKPSLLSGSDDSFFNNLGKKIKYSQLRKLEQNLTDDNDFTMMSNREFELLFNSTDRSDEIAYRLLFTPLAQQHMVSLLNDKKAGYGDDFNYYKKGLITTISSRHLTNFHFSTEPLVLNEYDLKIAKQRLFSYYMEFFRKVYFTLAPLFTIPLYNEKRNYIPPLENEKTISDWELESLAHYQGEKYYQHPACITKNLLKVSSVAPRGNGATAFVTAIGFRGIPMTDCVQVFGGDDRWHNVYVDWTRYERVEKTSTLSAYRSGTVTVSGNCTRRRSLVAPLPY